MPLISVVIPAYNAEKTILETVQSVLNQTISDIEIIIINDGSQDSTLEVISNLKDERLKIFSYPNSGANISRNRGLHHASGDYISFLDADDLWTSDKLEAQLGALNANPQAAVAYSWTNFIDTSGKVLHRGSYLSVSGNVFAELLILNFLENGSNPLIRKQALIEVNGFDESLHACQDWDLWLRLAAQHEFVAVEKAQILYRVSTGSISSNVTKLEAACIKVLKRTYSQAPQSLQHLKRYSFGNIYKYLTFKSFGGYLSRKNALIALRFLFKVIKNDPSMFKTKVVWKVLLNSAIAIILPAQAAKNLFSKIGRLSDVSALLTHIRADFSDLNICH